MVMLIQYCFGWLVGHITVHQRASRDDEETMMMMILMVLMMMMMMMLTMQALTRCQKVKSRREREIWNPHLEFREEKREMSRSVFWFEKRTRTFAKKMVKF